MPCSRETTGGQTRCEEARKPGSRRRAERGNGQRCCERRNLGHRIPKMLPSLRIQRARTIRHVQMKAAQKERASSAWSYSNPDRGGRAMSNASTCSTAPPVLALSRPRSQKRTLPERLRVPHEELAQPAFFTSVDAHSVFRQAPLHRQPRSAHLHEMSR